MIITSKYQSWCNRCQRHQIQIGERCEWDRGVKGVTCLACMGTTAPSAPPTRERARVDAPQLPPALAALDGLETHFVRMAAKTATPAIDMAWSRYEKIKALALNGAVTKPEQRTAVAKAICVLATAIVCEESAYVC